MWNVRIAYLDLPWGAMQILSAAASAGQIFQFDHTYVYSKRYHLNTKCHIFYCRPSRFYSYCIEEKSWNCFFQVFQTMEETTPFTWTSGKRRPTGKHPSKLFQDPGTGYIYRQYSYNEKNCTRYLRCRLDCGGTAWLRGTNQWVSRKPHASYCQVNLKELRTEEMKAAMKDEAARTGDIEPAFRRVENV